MTTRLETNGKTASQIVIILKKKIKKKKEFQFSHSFPDVEAI